MEDEFLTYLRKNVRELTYRTYKTPYLKMKAMGLENRDKVYDEIRKFKTTKQNNYIKTLNHYEKFLGTNKIYKLTKVREEDKRQKEDYLKLEEVLTVIRATKTIRVKAEIATMYGTGIRVNELITMRHNNIDTINKRITGIKGKGNKTVNSYFLDNYFYNVLSDYMIWKKNSDRLKEYCQDDSYVFCTGTGNHIARSTAWYDIREAVKVLPNKKSISPHTFRHSFVYKAMEDGMPQDVISKNLGHSSTFVTETVYTHYTQDLQQKRFFISKNNSNKEKIICPNCGYDEIENNFLYCPQCQWEFKVKCSCMQTYKINYRYCPFCKEPNVKFNLKQINKINLIKQQAEKIKI